MKEDCQWDRSIRISPKEISVGRIEIDPASWWIKTRKRKIKNILNQLKSK